MKQILKTIETLIWESRIIALLAVIACAVSAIILFVYGSIEILDLFKGFWLALTGKGAFYRSHTYLVSKVVAAVNLYLFATLMFVVSAGMQSLFIGRNEASAADPNAAKIMQIQSLDHLKERIISLVHVILVVIFFKYSLSMNYTSVLTLLYLAGGIVLIAASVFLASRK